MSEKVHSLTHWNEIHKNSKNLERQANRLLRNINDRRLKGKEFNDVRFNKFNKKPKKKKQQWIQPKYKDYIKSKAWFNRRERHFSMFGEICVVCGVTNNIDVHHISYRHLGREQDEELVSLCRDHHKAYHEQYGVKRDNINTHQFIVTESSIVQFDEIVKTLK